MLNSRHMPAFVADTFHASTRCLNTAVSMAARNPDPDAPAVAAMAAASAAGLMAAAAYFPEARTLAANVTRAILSNPGALANYPGTEAGLRAMVRDVVAGRYL